MVEPHSGVTPAAVLALPVLTGDRQPFVLTSLPRDLIFVSRSGAIRLEVRENPFSSITRWTAHPTVRGLRRTSKQGWIPTIARLEIVGVQHRVDGLFRA